MKGLTKKSLVGFIVGVAVLSCGLAMAQEMVVDVKPGGCTDPVNTRSKGVIPVAIVGLVDAGTLTVANIDPASVRIVGVEDDGQPVLFIDPVTGEDDSVAAIRSALEDVGAPVDCEALPDGSDDLVLKFRTQALVSALNTYASTLVTNNNDVTLLFEATLEDDNGTAIPVAGADDILLKVKKPKQ